jgi:hypothetical protein
MTMKTRLRVIILVALTVILASFCSDPPFKKRDNRPPMRRYRDGPTIYIV